MHRLFTIITFCLLANTSARAEEVPSPSSDALAASASTVSRAKGPSRSYPARVISAVRRNVVLKEPIEGNPRAEIEVRTSPNGAIVEVKLVKSSGVAAWDQAALHAIERTERLPLDVDGSVPPVVIFSFKPKAEP